MLYYCRIGRFCGNKWMCNCSLTKIICIFAKYNQLNATLSYTTQFSTRLPDPLCPWMLSSPVPTCSLSLSLSLIMSYNTVSTFVIIISNYNKILQRTVECKELIVIIQFVRMKISLSLERYTVKNLENFHQGTTNWSVWHLRVDQLIFPNNQSLKNSFFVGWLSNDDNSNLPKNALQ